MGLSQFSTTHAPINLVWSRYHNGWYNLALVDFTNFSDEGVYIIWRGGAPPAVIRVGQGNIAARLTAHRGDHQITSFGKAGCLYATWASLESIYRDGVERFLADRLRPSVGDAFPRAKPIPVNLPW